MAKLNEGDILTGDWNPLIGCERYSEGCKRCWYLDAILPWQQRLGNIPASLRGDEHYVFENRFDDRVLAAKNGIVGIVQHGDLFWDQVPDSVIHRVLQTIDRVAVKKRRVPKYVLWTKRAERMATLLENFYKDGLPPYLAVAVSVENQRTADERLPFLGRVKGTRIIVAEPLLGAIDLTAYLPVEWVIVGSETGKKPRPIDVNWVRSIRDQAMIHSIPFFVKQLGTSHKKSIRELDGCTWTQFPWGFEK